MGKNFKVILLWVHMEMGSGSSFDPDSLLRASGPQKCSRTRRFRDIRDFMFFTLVFTGFGYLLAFLAPFSVFLGWI